MGDDGQHAIIGERAAAERDAPNRHGQRRGMIRIIVSTGGGRGWCLPASGPEAVIYCAGCAPAGWYSTTIDLDEAELSHTWANRLPAPCRDRGVFGHRENFAHGWRRSMPELLVYSCEFTRKTLVFHRSRMPRRLIRRCVSVG